MSCWNSLMAVAIFLGSCPFSCPDEQITKEMRLKQLQSVGFPPTWNMVSCSLKHQRDRELIPNYPPRPQWNPSMAEFKRQQAYKSISLAELDAPRHDRTLFSRHRLFLNSSVVTPLQEDKMTTFSGRKSKTACFTCLSLLSRLVLHATRASIQGFESEGDLHYSICFVW